MALVAVDMLAKKSGITPANLGQTYDAYRQIASQNGWITPKNGFVPAGHVANGQNYVIDSVHVRWAWVGDHTQMPALDAFVQKMNAIGAVVLEYSATNQQQG